MSLLKTISLENASEPEYAEPLPERHIEGNPQFTSWPVDSARDDTIHSGIWQSTPGAQHSIKGTVFEFCHILEGVVELTEQGKEPVIYRAGDSFIMKPGFVGVWRTIETVRKVYVIAE